MNLKSLYHVTYKESPYKFDMAAQNMMARAGLFKRTVTGETLYLPLGALYLDKVIREELSPFICNGYSLCEGNDLENILFGDLKSYKHLSNGLVSSYTLSNVQWAKLGIAEGDQCHLVESFNTFETFEQAMAEMKSFETHRIYDHLCDHVTNATELGVQMSYYYSTASGSSDYFTCLENCGEHFDADSKTNGRTFEDESSETALQMELVFTPDQKTILDLQNFMNVHPAKILKTIIVEASGTTYAVLLRGDRELNMNKLGKVIGINPKSIRLMDKDVFALKHDIEAGFIGPCGLKGIKIIADNEITTSKNLICGANQKDHHFKNVNPERDYKINVTGDIKSFETLDSCPTCGNQELNRKKGLLVARTLVGPVDGISFDRKIAYLDKSGKEKIAYGSKTIVNIEKLLSIYVESNLVGDQLIFKEKKGIFEIILTVIDPNDEDSIGIANELFQILSDQYAVLVDDTDNRAGIKFMTADAFGIPYRITIGKAAKEGNVEIKNRILDTIEMIPYKQIKDFKFNF